MSNRGAFASTRKGRGPGNGLRGRYESFRVRGKESLKSMSMPSGIGGERRVREGGEGKKAYAPFSRRRATDC